MLIISHLIKDRGKVILAADMHLKIKQTYRLNHSLCIPSGAAERTIWDAGVHAGSR